MAGNIAKVAPITEGEDITHAKSRKAAMDRAKIKLTDAAEKANGNVVSARSRAERRQPSGCGCCADSKAILECIGTARLASYLPRG